MTVPPLSKLPPLVPDQTDLVERVDFIAFCDRTILSDDRFSGLLTDHQQNIYKKNKTQFRAALDELKALVLA